MQKFRINWSVTEIINGPGQHDDFLRDGDRNVVASGKVEKEATSADELRAALTHDLSKAFPRQGLGATYNIDRVYDIDITPVP